MRKYSFEKSKCKGLGRYRKFRVTASYADEDTATDAYVEVNEIHHEDAPSYISVMRHTGRPEGCCIIKEITELNELEAICLRIADKWKKRCPDKEIKKKRLTDEDARGRVTVRAWLNGHADSILEGILIYVTKEKYLVDTFKFGIGTFDNCELIEEK